MDGVGLGQHPAGKPRAGNGWAAHYGRQWYSSHDWFGSRARSHMTTFAGAPDSPVRAAVDFLIHRRGAPAADDHSDTTLFHDAHCCLRTGQLRPPLRTSQSQPSRPQSRANPLSLMVLGGEQPPVPFGDDLDGAVGHLDGGLVVDRVRRTCDAGRPLLPQPWCSPAASRDPRAGRSRSQRLPACCRHGPATSTRQSPHRSWGSSPGSPTLRPSRPSRAVTASDPPTRTAASRGTGTGRRRPTPAGRLSLGPGEPSVRHRFWAAR